MPGTFPGLLTGTGAGGTAGTATNSEILIDDTFLATEILSGGGQPIAVGFDQSGMLQTAMASVSGRMPAIGIVNVNVARSGTATVYRNGRLFSSGFNFSGWPNQPVYVGRSGQVVASGAPTFSGDVQQILGVSINASGMFLQVGDPLEGVILQSGDIGSGAVTGQAGGGSFVIASGTIGTNDIGSGAIVSGLVGSGQLGVYHLQSGLMVSGLVLSGSIGSGQLGTNHFSSGAIAPTSQFLAPIYSGTSWTLLTEERISGYRAVSISQSGNLRVAMAAVSGRMPAVGVVVDNVASGIQANVYTDGLFQITSGLANFSGYLGEPVWIGRSGQLVVLSGWWASGGYASGDIGQKLGTAINSGGLLLRLNTTAWSGGPLGEATGGIL